eukprot:TRINITY_DN3961_c0_g1_i1.p1 TRINITY_DN3961_c0_g1~~TRINITY_DN3961_c0_g1_i1.p1  ORF type:complete len:245 (+),score=51.56 TRINITY_DN3961_c0_g1_i1:75-737(+)
MSAGKFELAQECLRKAVDLSGLLLLSTAMGNVKLLEDLARMAAEKDKSNIAFLCLFLLGKVEDCVRLLCASGRIPEAALMARTYSPSMVPEIVHVWHEDLRKVNQKAAESLADPSEYPNLFPNFEWALKAEEQFKLLRAHLPPAPSYPEMAGITLRDPIAEIRAALEGGMLVVTENGHEGAEDEDGPYMSPKEDLGEDDYEEVEKNGVCADMSGRVGVQS